MRPGSPSPGSPSPALVEALEAMRTALAERRWADALREHSQVEALGPAPTTLSGADLDGLGEAAWWSGRLGDAIDYRERAVAEYVAEGEPARAARVAIHLATDHGHRSEATIGAGWIKRTERLLADLPLSPAHGWLARAHVGRALSAGDVEGALVLADEVLSIGARLADRDLEVMGLQDRGRVLIALGRVEEGLEALDEAVVAALAGEVSPYPAAAVFCNATIACEDLTDFRRAQAFADTAKRWCDRQSIAGFPGMCRVRRVELIALRGAWEQAELEARLACEELIDFSHDFAAEGFYQIGEIRRRMGDLAGAEAAFTEAHRLGRDPLPGLALLRLDQDRPKAAATMLARALADPTLVPLRRARLLPAEVVAALGVRDLGRAEAAAASLESTAATFATDLLRAEALTARGRVATAGGDAEAAIAAFREAVQAWSKTGAPYEIASAREGLAAAYLAAGDLDAAVLEAGAASAAYSALGAEAAAARALDLPSDRPVVDRANPDLSSATFMFTDIVGSTSLIEAVGDEAWGTLLAWHDTTIRALLRTHRGREIHHAGDGFFVSFGSAAAAIDCAIAIRRTLLDHRRQHGFAPAVRIGLHTAEALRTSSGFEGRGVHVAARIGALAGPDEILVSRATLEAAGRDDAHGSLRRERLRGIREPVELASLA